jgi:hypothetical protein
LLRLKPINTNFPEREALLPGGGAWGLGPFGKGVEAHGTRLPRRGPWCCRFEDD